MNFLREFKEFSVKGNMVDIAIGVIIGAAFNDVVNVIVKEIFMPPLSLLTERVQFANKKWVIREEEILNGETITSEVAIGYGQLIETATDFLIIAFAVFMVVKFMNSMRKKAEDPKDTAVETPKHIELLSNIETLLQRQNEYLQKQR